VEFISIINAFCTFAIFKRLGKPRKLHWATWMNLFLTTSIWIQTHCWYKCKFSLSMFFSQWI